MIRDRGLASGPVQGYGDDAAAETFRRPQELW
jgi:hypothetical protein